MCILILKNKNESSFGKFMKYERSYLGNISMKHFHSFKKVDHLYCMKP